MLPAVYLREGYRRENRRTAERKLERRGGLLLQAEDCRRRSTHLLRRLWRSRVQAPTSPRMTKASRAGPVSRHSAASDVPAKSYYLKGESLQPRHLLPSLKSH